MTSARPTTHDWLTPDETTHLAPGTAVAIETTGRHDRRTVGRITSATSTSIALNTPRGERTVDTIRIRRARIVPSPYEPGDPVLLRHIPAAQWRGGVVRTEGTDVLVEQLDGTFAWHPERALEPADARDPALPPLPRGPVPARTA